MHRGIEKLFEGRTPADGIELAERVSGDTVASPMVPTGQHKNGPLRTEADP